MTMATQAKDLHTVKRTRNMDEWRKAVRKLQDAVTDVADTFIPEEEFADAAGYLREAETVLANVRKGILSEAVESEGEHFAIRVIRRAERSYNTPGLLAAFASTGEKDMASTIFELIQLDIMRVSWQWTKLKKAMWDHRLDLHVAPHEIDDGDLDGPLVGEVWKEDTRVVTKEEQ